MRPRFYLIPRRCTGTTWVGFSEYCQRIGEMNYVMTRWIATNSTENFFLQKKSNKKLMTSDEESKLMRLLRLMCSSTVALFRERYEYFSMNWDRIISILSRIQFKLCVYVGSKRHNIRSLCRENDFRCGIGLLH